jgi:hypothetical protein
MTRTSFPSPQTILLLISCFCQQLRFAQKISFLPKKEFLESVAGPGKRFVNDGDKIEASYLDSVNSRPDTLETFLNFLKGTKSPVTTGLDLRSLLLAQKEEKIALQSLVDQTRVDMQGIR